MLLFLCFFILIATLRTTTAKRVEFDLTISQSRLDPDCAGTAYPALLINNQFPGPTLRVSQNDEVEIRIHNQAPVPTSVHFHGIRQYGTVESDGVPGVTQDAIQPGTTYVQRFKLVDQSGTFYYHAHVGVQDDTVQGALIVENSPRMMELAAAEFEPSFFNAYGDDPRDYPYKDGPYGYHGELLLHLSEWWHRANREAFYLGPEYTHDPNADSVLLNGRTIHQDATEECGGHEVLDVLPNRTYRLRVIGGNTFRTYGLAIKDHPMTIIEVDGELIYPYTTTHLEVTPGQRFSVLIHTDQVFSPDPLFTIATSYRHRNRGSGYTENGFGYLRYVNPSSLLNKRDGNLQKRTVSHKSDESYSPLRVGFPEIPEVVPRDWIWPELRPLHGAHPEFRLFEPADRTLKIRTWTAILPDGSTRYLINGKLTSKHSNTHNDDDDDDEEDDCTLSRALTTTAKHAPTEPDGFEPTLGTYPIALNETVDLVLQNAHAGRNCLLHPWHTHGHSHYVIASGDGEYIHDRDHAIRNFPHPIYKDVTSVYATETDPATKGCGWTKIRIYADNPGVWAVHCHITAHMLQGKMFLLEEASEWINAYRLYQ